MHEYLVATDRLKLKFIWKYKESRIAKTIIKMNKITELILSEFKIYYKAALIKTAGFPGGEVVKNPRRRHVFSLWASEITWRRKWQPTPVFVPGKFHGRRSLVGYSPRGHKESDVT